MLTRTVISAAMSAYPLRAWHQKPKQAASQRGSTAVEFALIFPVFFTIFYAIVSYGLILTIQQCLTLAAEEGGRAALQYQPAATQAAALTARATAACTTARSILSWLPQSYLGSSPCTATPAACSYDPTGLLQCIKVTLVYNYGQSPLIPPLPYFGVLLPSKLVGSASVQLNPATILSG